MAPEYVRTFPAAHASWIRAEIEKLVDAIPSQPSWASDPLRTGECMVLVKLIPSSTTPTTE